MSILTTECSVFPVRQKESSGATSIHSSRSGVGSVTLCFIPTAPTQNNFIQRLYNIIGKNEKSRVVRTVSEVAEVDGAKVKNLSRLEDMATLEENWNGYGAKGFSAALIAKCKEILNLLPQQPELYPTGRQTIHLQYELEDRSYLGFEISEEKTTYLKVPQRKYDEAEERELAGADEVKKIKELVADFYGYSDLA